MDFETVLTDDLINKYVSQGYWSNKPFGDYLNDTVSCFPDNVAIVDKKGSLTYKKLNKLVFRFATFMLELGIKKNDIVSVQMPSWHEFAIIHFGLSKIGIITNPIAPYYRQNELEYFLQKAGSTALIIPDMFKNFNYPEMVKKIAGNLPKLKHIIVVGTNVCEGMIPFSETIKDNKEDKYPKDYLEQFTPSPNDIHVLMFTSGTESKAKGVLHTHNTYCNATLNIVEPLGLDNSSVFFMAAPVTHTTGIRFGVRLPMMLGAKVVLQDIFKPEKALQLIAKEKCSISVGATPFLHSLINASKKNNEDISSFKIFGCGGAPIPRALIKEGEKHLGCKVLAGFGSTESPSQTFNKIDDDEKIYTTDGYPVKGVELKIVDETGKKVPKGQSGEALCRGPQLFVGYYKDPEITQKSFSKDGFFSTGDLCVLDKEGYLKVVGRKKDIIIRGGLNISTTEVENILLSYPKIKNIAIIGMPDPRLGERICAYIVPEDNVKISFQEVVNYLKSKKVAVIKQPERIEIVDKLPMTQSGKVKKNILRNDIACKLKM